MFCAPGVGNKTTCYSKDNLVYLIKRYNEGKFNKHKIPTTGSKKKLWNELNKIMKKDCNSEWCWLEKNFITAPYAKKMLKERFRTKKPEEWKKNPFEWLSTDDIKNVMKQYEKEYPTFLFMGPFPADCPSSITCSLSGLDVKILKEKLGKNKLGIIYNMDTHNKPGSHWIAVFMDFKKGLILYYDSVGMSPPKLIYNFLKKMKNNYELHTGKKANIYYNDTQFQFGNTECGMFSMNFIISCLKGQNIYEKGPEKINDKLMNELRNKLYRPN